MIDLLATIAPTLDEFLWYGYGAAVGFMAARSLYRPSRAFADFAAGRYDGR